MLARPPSLRSFVVGLAAVALVCLGAAYAAFTMQKHQIEADVRRTLGNIAVLKANQIDHWRRERMADGMAISAYSALGFAFDRWLARGAADDGQRRWMLQQLDAMRSSHDEDYRSLQILDRNGRVRLGTPDGLHAEDDERQLALEAMASRETLMGEIRLDPLRHRPVLGMAAPLVVGEGEAMHVVGALFFRVDPSRFIYPLIESWPIDSKTAETLLVRRDGDSVLFLNRLRHREGDALTLRMPLDRADLPAAQALRGKTGIAGGHDYRGEPVVSYLLPVPDTAWSLVAKIDESEVYAPLRELAWYAAAALLMTLSFAAYVFWTLRARAEMAYHGYRTQLHNRMLTQRLENVAKSASDIIVFTDDKGRIIEVNDRAVEAFGYSRAEMLEMTAGDLRVPECRARIAEDLGRIRANGSAAFETVYRRKDGSWFCADVAGHLVSAGSESYMQAIIRDISERKRTEAALRLHEQMTRSMQEGLSVVRASDGILVFANPRLETMFGYAPGELPGKHVSCLNASDEGNPQEVAARIMAALHQFGSWSGEIRNARKDGTPFWCKSTVSAFEHPDHGKVWLSIHTDITALKGLELVRQDHVARIRKLGRHLVAVQETERRKLGAELHDRTSANLAAARLLLKDLAALLPRSADGMLEDKMEDLQALFADTDATIRDISGSLRPPLLDFLGLTATLQSLAGKFEKRTGMTITVRNRQVPRLDGDAETLLYRIVQEALTNCAKHSQARRVAIDLSMADERVELTVADDGVGFDAGIAARGETLGLLTMRERAEFADGILVVDSTLGHGTVVRVVMPGGTNLAAESRTPRLAARSVAACR